MSSIESVADQYRFLSKYLEKFHKNPRRRSQIVEQTLSPWLRSPVSPANHPFPTKRLLPTKKKSSILELSATELRKRLTGTLLAWWQALLDTAQYLRNADQTVFHECIIDIISRHELRRYDQSTRPQAIDAHHATSATTDKATQQEYHRLLKTTLCYAIDKTNQANPEPGAVIFCAHILALCFFKLPGLASWLLAALPVQPRTMRRMRAELITTDDDASLQQFFKERLFSVLPSHWLHPLEPTASSDFPLHAERWLKRWQTGDRALFVLFYQRYHSHLKGYIVAATADQQHPLSVQQRNTILALAPGYLHLAAYLADQVIDLLQYNSRPLTDPLITTTATATPVRHASSTGPPTDNTGKPKHLELATRRYAYCFTWCAVESDTSHWFFQDTINTWIRAIVKSICGTNAPSVFCLLDFLEHVLIDLQKKHQMPLLDIPFLLHALHLLLSKVDNATVQLRALAFIYTHFEFLTMRPECLGYLCKQVLLQPALFENLLLHWHEGVRMFFLQCLYWRIRPLWSFRAVRWRNENDACDGKMCRIAWQNDVLHRSSVDDKSLLDDRYQLALEIHITLESLLTSFQQHFNRIESLVSKATDTRTRHVILNQLRHELPGSVPEQPPAIPSFQSCIATVPKAAAIRLEPKIISASTSSASIKALRRLSSVCSRTLKRSSVVFERHSTHFTLDTPNEQYCYTFAASSDASSDTSSSYDDSGYISSGQMTPSSRMSWTPPTMTLPEWQYAPPRHTYATKVMQEMERWIDQQGWLSVDWPRGW